MKAFEKGKRWSIQALKAMTLMWLVVHFLLTTLYLMPLNPIKIYLRPLLDATIGTYFAQNWSLFAPNPVSDDLSVLVHPLTEAQVQSLSDGRLPTQGWYNISDPLWQKFQGNRFSAYDRMARTQTSSVRRVLNGGIELMPIHTACEKGDEDACADYQERLKTAREGASNLLVKVASAFTKDLHGANSGYEYIAIRVRVTKGVPWSERHTGEPTSEDLEIGIYPINKEVTPMGLFQRTAL